MMQETQNMQETSAVRDDDLPEDLTDLKNGPEDSSVPPKPKKKHGRKWIWLIVLAGVCAAVFFILKNRSAATGYTEETVQLRDIMTYHSFTGTIQPVHEQNVLPNVSGVKVTKVCVEEGDTVSKGDVLFQLDTTSIDQQINELEATMTATEKQNAVAIEQAQTTYGDYKDNLDNGMNSQVLSAQQAIDSAFSQLVSAQQAYNAEVTANNQSLSSTMLSAIQAVDSAYGSVRTAELSAQQAVDALNSADSSSRALEDNVNTTKLAAENAWTSYNAAKTSFEAAKLSEDNKLTSDYDALVTAQTSYLNAIDTYNSTVTGARQQLNAYSLSVQSAQAGADQSVNTIKLADLRKQLDNYTVKSPISGVVTVRKANEGDITVAGTAMATVTNFDRMKVDIKINEYDIQGAETGKPVTISVDALDNKSYDGTIAKIARVATVDNGVSYFKSEVDFDGDDDARSGMSVEVKLTINDLKQVVTVSNDAVSTNADGSAYVMKYADAKKKKMIQQPVTIGATDGSYTQITEGLKAGDTVLVAPAAPENIYEQMNGSDDSSTSDSGN
jgi:HlyD family secretion protein